MNLEQAKEKLKKIEGYKDPLFSSFYGGRVGFRKPTKKYRQEQERHLNNACEAVRLREFIEKEERKLLPKVDKPSPYFASVEEIEIGKQYYDCHYGLITIKKKNKNTVTIQTASGYTEARKPHFIYK
jgi:hypothetical protein